MEEERARKKISETKGRAEEIYTLKKRNNERLKQRRLYQQQRSEFQKGDTDTLNMIKKQNRDNIVKAKAERHDRNRKSAQDTHNHRKQNEASIRQQKSAFREANAAMRATIQERQSIARKKRADTMQSHQEALASKAQARLKDEKDRRARADKMLPPPPRGTEALNWSASLTVGTRRSLAHGGASARGHAR